MSTLDADFLLEFFHDAFCIELFFGKVTQPGVDGIEIPRSKSIETLDCSGAGELREEGLPHFLDTFGLQVVKLELQRKATAGRQIQTVIEIRGGHENAVEVLELSQELHLQKPDPEIFRTAIRTLNAPPAETIFIDDNSENIAAASSCGLQTLHATPDIDWVESLNL